MLHNKGSVSVVATNGTVIGVMHGGGASSFCSSRDEAFSAPEVAPQTQSYTQSVSLPARPLLRADPFPA